MVVRHLFRKAAVLAGLIAGCAPATALAGGIVALDAAPIARVAAYTGGTVVSGTLRCATSGRHFMRISLTQDGPALPLSAIRMVKLRCDTTPTPFRLAMVANHGSFHAGPATLVVSQYGALSTYPATTTVQLMARDAPDPHYYVALGDSMAAGYGAPPGRGYVGDLFGHYGPQIPGLTLVNYACSGETTSSLVGRSHCAYAGFKSQLAPALSFLRAHRGAVSLVTVDVGWNDLAACRSRPNAYNEECFDAVLDTAHGNLQRIAGALRGAAGPGVPIVSMTQFDPLLGYWFSGAAGRDHTRVTVGAVDRLNAIIRGVYGSVEAPVADVSGVMEMDNFDVISTRLGSMPTNVARMCTWLDLGCPRPGATPAVRNVDDPNGAGSRVVAWAFEQVMPPLPGARR